MRILLRHTITNLYYQGPHSWTADPGLAFDFRFMDMAQRHAETWRMKNVELAFAFDDPQQITLMPLQQLRQAVAA